MRLCCNTADTASWQPTTSCPIIHMDSLHKRSKWMLYFRVSALNGDETSGTAEYHRYFGMRGTSSTAIHLDSSQLLPLRHTYHTYIIIPAMPRFSRFRSCVIALLKTSVTYCKFCSLLLYLSLPSLPYFYTNTDVFASGHEFDSPWMIVFAWFLVFLRSLWLGSLSSS